MKAGWVKLPFVEAIVDQSGGNIKTPQSEFLTSGRFAVVDQGKNLISGYVDKESRLCKASLPVIVFGDHTRCFKFVDFPFCMGADGVKVLRSKVEADVKYLFYYLRQLNLPDGGYDRHFKYLKRSHILLPPLEEQHRIAGILDRAQYLISKRREAIAQLDTLTQAFFFEMFGDPVTNPKGWPSIYFKDLLSMPLRNGVSLSNTGKVTSKVLTLSAITGNAFDETAWKTSTFQSVPPITQRVDQSDFLVCRGNGNIQLVGKGYFPTQQMPEVTFPDTMIAARISPELIERQFLQHIWNSSAVRRQLETLARTTNGTFNSLSRLFRYRKNLPVASKL
ncbi:MAG: restriction endonuclease subunit S [Goleter apudmare HA4340-LM2]|jgi:type I restriction enzyme S subunit|nr:restriction endonuclease subunit S [Goleter apudmare HA4340-LM2]